LLGLFVLGINFFNGLALAAGLTVLMVMLSALWFLPALLSLLGTKTLAIRLPWGKKPGSGHVDGHRWAAYGAFLQRRPWLWAVLSLAFVIILAIPVLSLRQGFSDDSGKPVGSISRTAYDLRAEGFGPGSNGPFLVVAQLPSAGDTEAYKTIVTELAAAPGVAGTNPSVAMLPLVDVFPQEFGLTGDVAVIGVVPSSAPQDQATTDLLTELRETVDPKIEAATGAKLYVGGTQAITSDFTTVLKNALPIFLLVVIGLGFLALVLLFRSIIVPATAAITSLLSFAASLGITVAVFQWGWFNSLLGISGTGPIMPFLPIMVFAILFGLSMDYQVFLVSRMREEWERTDDNRAAIRRGLAGSGRVVVIAALIMASVFMAFIPTPDATIKLFGISLASAVLIDAFIIRLIFVPSLMTIIGRPNWWLPRWLGKILPVVHVESESEDDEVDDVLPVKAGQ
jgi:RND superfamily putative drug exporter